MCFLQNSSLFYFWLWWVSAAALGLFVVGWGLLSRRGAWAQLPCGVRDLRHQDWTCASGFGKQILTHPGKFQSGAFLFFPAVLVYSLLKCLLKYFANFFIGLFSYYWFWKFKKKTYSGWFILCINLTEPREAQRASKTLFLGVAVKVSPKRLVSREDMP
jgi:hypothetical protein